MGIENKRQSKSLNSPVEFWEFAAWFAFIKAWKYSGWTNFSTKICTLLRKMSFSGGESVSTNSVKVSKKNLSPWLSNDPCAEAINAALLFSAVFRWAIFPKKTMLLSNKRLITVDMQVQTNVQKQLMGAWSFRCR